MWPNASQAENNLTDHQREQLARATSARLGLLTGTPGTGKTFTTGALVKVIAAEYGSDAIAVCAPTGKAAVRVTAAMRRVGVDIRATTIHTLLEIGRNGHDGDGWQFKHHKNNPLDVKFIVVDEASMVDTDLAAALFAAIGPKTQLLFVGDPYQLPPVGHGAPLRDLIAGGVPNGHLTEILRNAGMIVRACAAIKDGKPFEVSDRSDPDAGINLRHFEEPTPDEQIQCLLALYTKLSSPESFFAREDAAKMEQGDCVRRWRPKWDIQVLIATNDSGPLSRKPLNKILQNYLNPEGESHPDHQFRVGDKIICLRNHLAKDAFRPNGDGRYIANGEIGEVLDVAEPRKIVAKFSQPDRTILIPVSKKKDKNAEDEEDEGGSGAKGGDFDLAYAITTHKSQGSEWPVVIVMIDATPGALRLCSREWIYTALSRASRLCITVGKLGIAHYMARRPTLENRKTFLAELIRGEAKR